MHQAALKLYQNFARTKISNYQRQHGLVYNVITAAYAIRLCIAGKSFSSTSGSSAAKAAVSVETRDLRERVYYTYVAMFVRVWPREEAILTWEMYALHGEACGGVVY